MNSMLLDSLASAVLMLVHGESQVWGIILLSLRCTLFACLAACLMGIPLALSLSQARFRGRQGVILVLNSLQALPTVVVGLFLYILIGSQGPLGTLGLLYTPTAITLGQTVLILPLVTMLCLAAVNRLDTKYRYAALTLGATEWQARVAVMREARFALMAALCAAFGRGIAEVGVSMMLGGNIKGFTRTMTTAMALEYDKGEFALALALGIVLLLTSFLLNAILHLFQRRMEQTA